MSESIRPSKSGKFLSLEAWDALKAVGYTEQELQEDQPFGPIIFAYTRAQAIEDGVLVDVTEIAKSAGFKLHTVITCGVSAALTEMVRKHRPQDMEKYPLYRIQYAAFRAMLDGLRDTIASRSNTSTSDRMDFTCVDVKLWSHIGPGDDGEAVLTIMLEGED